ncbi:hypothetical protein [Asanoa siamensis]|uniref:Uncharacterized protein n=1 Tax=Asanoa siamensis TaxID=926357 RepID=A0ABQ4CQY4_9ACTN|nr:hypothetical protein [Asanoa siamensis]GIF73699.1 hypothetical protein Asi02nite_32170 [Asanoa siamensis]
MTTILMDLRPATVPAPAEVWRSIWDITVTWRAGCDSRLVVDDPAKLATVVLRCSTDPRVVGYRYDRHDLLDMAASPATCFGCGEPYALARPRHWWRPCDCGGHHVYECAACAHRQTYPEVVPTCGI